MRRWKLLTVLAVGGALVAIIGAASAFAHGPTDSQNPPSDGGWWQEMSQHCPGAGGMMAGWGMEVGEMGLGHPVTLGRVADTLGLTYEELTARLAQGETIAQVALAQGVAVGSVVTTITAPQSEVLQIRVKYGYLSETQAQAILEQERLWIEQTITVPSYGSVGPSGGATSGYGPADMDLVLGSAPILATAPIMSLVMAGVAGVAQAA